MKKPGAVQRVDQIEDEWSKKATLEAIAAARDVISSGSINGRTMISSVSEVEWGWIVCAAIAGWIKTKARQAVAEGVGYDNPIRFMPGDMQPWEAGAVEAVLPALGELRFDWSKPIGDWSKDEIVSFAWKMSSMIAQSLVAQARGEEDKITEFSQKRQERELMARNGGPLMSRDETEGIPF